MLEYTCHLLDIKPTAYIATNNGDIQQNDRYIAVHQRAWELECFFIYTVYIITNIEELDYSI